MMWHGIMGFGWLFWFVIVAVAIMLLVYAAKIPRARKDHYNGKYMEILKERFARGEIGETEYEQKRKKLRE